MAYNISAVESALILLEAVAEHPGSGITQLAEITSSTKSHVFRLLYTLERRGFVSKHGEAKGYTLGYKALLVGEQAKGQMDLLVAAKPIMEQLTEQTAENSHLTVRDGLQSLTVAVTEGPHNLGLFAKPGKHGPLHAGGGSKVLLAHAPKEVQEQVLSSPLEEYSEYTITDPARLERVLLEIRQSGFHFCENDLDVGAFAVAAPVLNFENEVIAALSVAGPLSRIDTETIESHISLVRNAARNVSRLMGGTDLR